jgi:hypothetical protein
MFRLAPLLITAVLGTSACALLVEPPRFERLRMVEVTTPDSAVAGSVFEVSAAIIHSRGHEEIRLEPRVEGDTLVVIALARADSPSVQSIQLGVVRTLKLTAQPGPTMIIRFSSPSHPSIVRHVTVTPE